MFEKVPACMEKANKGQKIDQVLAIIHENENISFSDLRRLVCERLGVSVSTAYDYLRQARQVVNQQVAAAHKEKPPVSQLPLGEDLNGHGEETAAGDPSQTTATERVGTSR